MKTERELLAQAHEHVCSLLCPSVKKDGEQWTHVPLCEAITAALVADPCAATLHVTETKRVYEHSQMSDDEMQRRYGDSAPLPTEQHKALRYFAAEAIRYVGFAEIADWNRVDGNRLADALSQVLCKLQATYSTQPPPAEHPLSSGDAIACIAFALQNPDTDEWPQLLRDCMHVIERMEGELLDAKRQRNDESRLRQVAERAAQEYTLLGYISPNPGCYELVDRDDGGLEPVYSRSTKCPECQGYGLVRHPGGRSESYPCPACTPPPPAATSLGE